jgi:hypothetical protein
MRRHRLRNLPAILILCGGLLLRSALPAGAQSAPPPLAPGDLSVLPPLLPWPPLVPSPYPGTPFLPPGELPPLPSPEPGTPGWWPEEAGPPPEVADLPQFIEGLQRLLDLVDRWAGLAQQVASGVLGRMIWESPGLLPQGAELPDLLGELRLLPEGLRSALEAVLAKIHAPVLPGSPAVRHQAYTESSPTLAHEATAIAETDEVIAGGSVQQAVASRATSLAAAALARDVRLPATVAAARETGRTLLSAAQGLPSSRAGIELLVAGIGSGLEQQAELHAAVADRLTVLAQQTAEVSQQVGSLAATAGAMTAREAERDRRSLDAQMGLADALTEGAHVFGNMLAGAGEPSGDEVRLDPLY